MKVNPSLFPPNAPTPRSTGDASEARRAFEAMLSASASRTRVAQSPALVQDGTMAALVRQASPVQTKEPDANLTPLARPGRVLDIKV